MRVISDPHTHTVYSRMKHGKGTIEENTKAAIKKGLKRLYITDHGPGHIFFGLKRSELPNIKKEVERINEKYKGEIEVILGVEANVTSYDGKIDVKKEDMKYIDHLMVGFHSGVFFSDIKSVFYFFILNNLANWTGLFREFMLKKNTQALINIVNKYPVKVISHPGHKCHVDIVELARACEKNGTILEINSSHDQLTVDDLEKLKDSKVLFSIGSDAHRPERVGDFDRAKKRVRDSGLDPNRIVNVEV